MAYSKLNLGCGERHMGGFVNIDISSKCNPDYVWDILETPWPEEWAPPGEIEYIMMDNLLEHLYAEEKIKVMNECHRVLERGGRVKIIAPVLKPGEKFLNQVFSDPTHKSYFTEETFDYWDIAHNRHHIFGKDYGIEPFKRIEQFVERTFINITLEKP